MVVAALLLLLLMTLMLTAGTVHACIYYHNFLHPECHLAMSDDVGDLAMDGALVFYAGAYGDFEVVDLSDSDTPVVIGSTSIPANAFYMAYTGELAVLGCGLGGGRILDVKDPTDPTTVASFSLPDNVRGVAVRDGLAFVAASSAGLYVMDISDPANPQVVGSLPVPGYSLGVWLHDDLLFLAALGGQLALIDISTPTSPKLLGTIGFNDTVAAMVFDGGLTYLACSSAGLKVLDLTDPLNPQIVADVPTAPEYAEDLVVDGAVLYLAAWEQQLIWRFGGVRVFDVSDPASPQRIGSIETAMGAMALGLGDFGLGDFGHRANLLAVGDASFGLTVLQVTNPASPVETASLPVPGCQSVAYANNRVCAASSYFGLSVVDLGFMNEPEIVATYSPALGQIKDVACAGDLAYLACGSGGLQIVDASQTGVLTMVGDAPVSASADYVAATGNLALVTGSYFTLDIYDMSDPGAPLLLDSLDTAGSNWGLATNGQLAVVSGSMMVVIDISDPEFPEILSAIEPPVTGLGAAMFHHADLGDLVCLSGEREVLLYSLADPYNPTLVGSVPTPGESLNIAADDRFAYVTDGFGGVQVLDLAIAGAPYWYGSFDTDGYVVDVSLGGGGAYVADSSGAMRILPAQCPVGGTAVPDAGVDPVADHALELSLPAAAAFDLRVQPNPFNPRTTISFTLPADGTGCCALGLYDLAGRLVADLADGVSSAVHSEGRCTVNWDGRDRHGRPAPTGVYFVRLDVGGISAIEKAVLLR